MSKQFFPLYIARRYMISRKSRNVINIISWISVGGVTIGTMALIVILSVFNGLEGLISQLINSFAPDLEITLHEGKTFRPDTTRMEEIRDMEGVASLTEVIEETALLEYNERQYIGQIKGVSDDFLIKNGIDTMMWDGEFKLHGKGGKSAVLGYGVAYNLGVGLKFINPLHIYIPRRSGNVMLNPEGAFNRKMIFPAGIFSIQNEYDRRYVFVPLDFAASLLNYENKLTSLEVRFKDSVTESERETLQKKVKSIMGPAYKVLNQRQQHATINKIMQSEKWMIFLILSFVLFIASFNIVGSLTMLIIDKKDDIVTLRSLGANSVMIRNIFLIEGWMISLIGAFIGLVTGLIICIAQIQFGLVEFPASTIVDAYPVKLEAMDFVSIFLIVIVIGFLAAYYPVRFITRRYIKALQTK